MPTACILKKGKTDKGYCGEDVSHTNYGFQDPDYAYQHYDKEKHSRPDPKRLWACPKCIDAITKERAAAEPTYLNNLIGAQGGTK